MTNSAMPFRCLLVAGWLALSLATAEAHDLWLSVEGAADARRVIVNYGHPDDRPPAVADKLLDLVAITEVATTSLLPGLAPAMVDGHVVVVSRPLAGAPATLFAGRYDNGVWVEYPDGSYRNATRRLVPNAVRTLWSAKFAKAIAGPGAPWQRVLGHDLEIVPLSDPALVKPGDALRVRVLFHGRPVVGVDVERGDGRSVVAENDIPRFSTDADGIASVPITARGTQLLVVDHRVTPSAVPAEVDADLWNATLWFSVE